MNIGLQQAINIAGSQKALAKLITEKTGNRACTQAVQQWCAKGFPPIKRVPDIVKALRGAVKPAQLRPDFFLEIEQGATQETPNGTEATETNTTGAVQCEPVDERGVLHETIGSKEN